jgi:hypothetical protein
MDAQTIALIAVAVGLAVLVILGIFLARISEEERAYYAARGIDIDGPDWPTGEPVDAVPEVFHSARAYSGNSHQRRIARRADQRGAL